MPTTVPRRADLPVVLGPITAVGPLSIDLELPAFPQTASGFGVTDAQVQLSLTSCLLGLAVSS